MTDLTFHSTHEHLGMLRSYTAAEIEAEPMFFDASLHFASEHGGPITQDFCDHLTPGIPWLIDSRVHMLMPGWFPAIPGWHHDDVPRSRSDGQPNYDNPAYQSQHIACVIDATDQPTESLTEFIEGMVTLPYPYGRGRSVYGYWNDELEAQLFESSVKKPSIFRLSVLSREVIGFDCNAFHKAVPAKTFGWRMFIRATTNTKDVAVDKIRRQANVYLPQPMEGW